jgi:CRISPR-associated protein Cas2
MTEPRKHWYLIAYDVRDDKRLSRVHRYLRKRALAVQKSVFLIHTEPRAIAEIEDGLRALADQRQDDLRLYAIPGPAAVWAAGQQAKRLAGLHGAHAGAPQGSRVRRWLDTLLGREAA